MDELRTRIAELVRDMPDYGTDDDEGISLGIADRILALPEIAEALEFTKSFTPMVLLYMTYPRVTERELAALLLQALEADNPDALVGSLPAHGRTLIDGRFNLVGVAGRLLAALRDAERT